MCERLDPAICKVVSKPTCLTAESARKTCPYTCEECECRDTPIKCEKVSHEICENFHEMKAWCPISCGLCGIVV